MDLLSFKFLYLVLPFTHAAVAWGAAVTTGCPPPPRAAWIRGAPEARDQVGSQVDSQVVRRRLTA